MDKNNLPKKPLNWKETKLETEKVSKAITPEDARLAYMRQGTPPTRSGGFNGAKPSLEPKAAPMPALIVKAVIDPGMAGGGSKDSSTSRKRDPISGKFSDAGGAGPQSTAEDDQSDQMRQANLVQGKLNKFKRIGKAFGSQDMGTPAPSFAKPPASPFNAGGNVDPGMAGGSTAAMDSSINPSAIGQPGAQPMGQTQSGMPVYDDPYHPDHGAFGPQDHQEAAQMHTQQADGATASGRIPTALDHQMKASIHSDLAGENMSPSERMAGKQAGQGLLMGDQADGMEGMEQPDLGQMDPNGMAQNSAMPGQPSMGAGASPGMSQDMQGSGGGDAMDQFLTQLPDTSGNNMAGAGDQGKPIFGGNQAMPQGPKPGMYNTQTGGPMGPQTAQMPHAGTMQQPQSMPQMPMNGTDMNVTPTADSSYLPNDTPDETDGPGEYQPKDFAGGDMGGDMSQGAPDDGSGMPLDMGDGSDPSMGDESGAPDVSAGPDAMDDSGMNDQSGDDGSDEDSGFSANSDDDSGDTEEPKKKESAPHGSFGGNEVEDRAKKEQGTYQKSFYNWFNSIK